MEGTHGQLGTGFADGLSGNDADGLTKIDLLGGGQVHAVALGAHAHPGAAAQNGADIDLVDAVLLELLRVLGHHHDVLGVQQLAGLGIDHIVDGITAADAVAEGIDHVAVLVVHRADPDAVGGAAVVLPDDDVLRNVHHSTGQVTGVGGTQSGIGHALTGASGGDEVFQNGQAFTEVRLNGNFDGTACGIGHQAAHTGQLTNLCHGTTSAGVGHHVDGVELVHAALQGVGDVRGGLFPLLNHQTVALVVGDIALTVEVLDLHDLLLRGMHHLVLDAGNHHVRDGHGDSTLGGILVAQSLDAVQHLGGDGEAVAADALVDDLAQLLLADKEADLQIELMAGDGAVNEAQILRDRLVVDQTADGGVDDAVAHLAVDLLAVAHPDRRVQTHGAGSVGGNGLVDGGIIVNGAELGNGLARGLGGLVGGDELVRVHDLVDGEVGIAGVGDEHGLRALLGLAQTGVGQIVRAKDHILRRHGDGLAVLRTQQVVGGQHQHSGLSLRLGRQGYVNGHLVAVEVGVEGGAAQRMQLQGAAFHQNRLESLNAQTVQGRRTVQHDRAVLDDLVQSVPDLGLALVDHLLGGLDVVGQTVGDQLLHNEGAEQLDGHLLGHAALIQLQLRADDDNAASGVVNTLAEQVLTEAALLALEHVGQRLQRPVVGAGDGAAAAAVVD